MKDLVQIINSTDEAYGIALDTSDKNAIGVAYRNYLDAVQDWEIFTNETWEQ